MQSQAHGSGRRRHQGVGPAAFHQKLGQGAGPGQEAERLVKVADRKVARLPPAQDQLGGKAEVGRGHQHPYRCAAAATAEGPEGDGQHQQEQGKGREAKTDDRIVHQEVEA